MTILAAYGLDARGPEGLLLARQLARTGDQRLVVCCVMHNRWQLPTVAHDEHVRVLARQAEEALAEAREVVGDDAEFVARTGQSVAGVLLAEAEAQAARVLVCGSSAGGPWGHIAVGSVTNRLLHSSTVPIAVAPRGYRVAPDTKIARVTAGTDNTEAAASVLLTAARMTRALGATLRVATFAVRGRTVYSHRPDAEDAMIAIWKEQAHERQQAAVRELSRFEDVSFPDEVLIADGRDWHEALDGIGWQDGDVLAIGSSGAGLLMRVFVGSTATRILRYSPVPVIVVPRTN
ncbi:MAG: universal stress protein [Microlunatus sp.]|nr:universal stress protein [Microlunatus sp.]MDN5769600.1 universal stress protein [Microlunatus sp.]MDN5804475.1 universal stress protein [Microlunatus sp.]